MIFHKKLSGKELGRLGERIACKHLNRLGYKIICRNYVTSLGEIDIIAKDKDTLVLVEVKTRSSNAFGLPSESVDYRKRRKLLMLAKICMGRFGSNAEHIRFDVVSILIKGLFKRDVTLIRNAFNGDDV